MEANLHSVVPEQGYIPIDIHLTVAKCVEGQRVLRQRSKRLTRETGREEPTDRERETMELNLRHMSF